MDRYVTFPKMHAKIWQFKLEIMQRFYLHLFYNKYTYFQNKNKKVHADLTGLKLVYKLKQNVFK